MEKQIVITDSYMTSVSKLSNQERKQAINTIRQMKIDLATPSLKVHAIDKEKCDAKFRSARVSSDVRLIFYLDGDYCTLLHIDHHDAAYDWCVGKYCKKTDFGATYIFDVLKEEQYLANFTGQNEDDDEEYCYAGLKKNNITEKQLVKLGLSKIHANNLLSIIDEEEFVEYIDLFPEELQEALLDLYIGDKPYDVVFNELQDTGNEELVSIDSSQSLLQKDSRRRFYVTQSMEELEYLMENEHFEKWTTFLHPSQERLTRIKSNGPVLVEGGPGTGKTVLGMHRAVFLSENVFKAAEGKKILFCTFSKKLSKYISSNIEKLILQKGIENNIEVIGVDAFIAQQLGNESLPVDPGKFNDLLKKVYRTGNWGYSLEFYQYEYYQVIEHFGILSEQEYIDADRTGMGTPLTENQRRKVWQFFKQLFKDQREQKLYTFVNRAEKLERMIRDGLIKPSYDAVIIDEAQDLEPCKLRAISACVKQGPDSMMILSDNNQRIYNLRSWKTDVGVNVVGRTFYLYINYRTTKEISDYATVLFFKGKNRNEYMKSYKSIVKGNDPIVQGYKNEEKQWEAIAATTIELQRTGVPANEICVVFPTNNELEKFARYYEKLGYKTLHLIDDIVPQDENNICICNIKGVKGLEFACVIIASANKFGSSNVEKYRVDDAAVICYEKQVDCERYVAATRARDTLFVTYIEE